MALSGVKDMSIIATPPVDRLAVRTFVMPSDPVTLREAIMRERFRGGQIFYVCPRISDLPRRAGIARTGPGGPDRHGAWTDAGLPAGRGYERLL